MPISTRVEISHASLCAAPPRTEKNAKIAEPMKNALRRPNRSASRPPVTISTPKVSA